MCLYAHVCVCVRVYACVYEVGGEGLHIGSRISFPLH